MKQINTLHWIARFSLFISSYSPLFSLIVIKQVSSNREFLSWGGINLEGIENFFVKFGVSSISLMALVIGLFGCFFTFKNIKQNIENGLPVIVYNVKNKNSEAASYITTYICPFLFQNFNDWYQILAIVVLFFIIYRIYINSSLLLVNPILSFWFSIYELEYLDNDKIKSGFVISRNKSLQDNSEIKIYEIGAKLFFARKLN